MSGTCWADPLSRKERAVLAGKLARATLRFYDSSLTAPGGRCSPSCRLNHAQLRASGECSELRIDVTERAEVAR